MDVNRILFLKTAKNLTGQTFCTLSPLGFFGRDSQNGLFLLQLENPGQTGINAAFRPAGGTPGMAEFLVIHSVISEKPQGCS